MAVYKPKAAICHRESLGGGDEPAQKNANGDGINVISHDAAVAQGCVICARGVGAQKFICTPRPESARQREAWGICRWIINQFGESN